MKGADYHKTTRLSTIKIGKPRRLSFTSLNPGSLTWLFNSLIAFSNSLFSPNKFPVPKA
jgi:hypothetical protein